MTHWRKARCGSLRVFAGNIIYWTRAPLTVGRVRGIVTQQGEAVAAVEKLAPLGSDTFSSSSLQELLVDFAAVKGALEYIDHGSTVQVLPPL